MSDFNAPFAPRVSVGRGRKEDPIRQSLVVVAETVSPHALTHFPPFPPLSFTRLFLSSQSQHQAYANSDAFVYKCQGMSGDALAQRRQVLYQQLQPMAAAAPPPPPPPAPHNHHHHASPKLWPSSQTAAVDAVAAAWAVSAARDRSIGRASSGGGGFISAQHSAPSAAPPQQLQQHLSRDSSSSSFGDPLAAFQQQQQFMNRPPRRREG